MSYLSIIMNNIFGRLFLWTTLFRVKTILAALCLLAFGMMLFSSLREAPIMDELAHIPAGYGYVKYLDYRLNPEHPPLLKALAAAPLLLVHENFPDSSPAWQSDVNGQWNTGHAFLYESGNDPDLLTRIARLLPILITLCLILLTYRVARDIMGPRWALLPAAFAALSPTILGQGHYVTTDIAATTTILLALWRAAIAIQSPTRRNIWLAGIALGLAEIAKFSSVLLLPYIIFMAAAHWLSHKNVRNGLLYFRTSLVIFAIAYLLVVYPVYALFTAHYPLAKQVSDTSSILVSYKHRLLADPVVAMSRHYITRPVAEYALGVLMVQQRAAGGNTSYFMGRVSAAGSHLYFPAVYLLKETLPALLLVLLPLIFWLKNFLSRRQRIFRRMGAAVRDTFLKFALAGFAIFYWIYSMQSPLNIGIRHILPVFPLMYILAADSWRRFTMQVPREGEALIINNSSLDIRSRIMSGLRTVRRRAFSAFIIGLLVLWAIIEVLISAPHFLSYYNEIGGGTYNGYRFALDSNYDWGQDMPALRDLLNTHPEIDHIAVDYFGGGDINYYLGSRAESWHSSNGDPRNAGIHWIAISLNALQESIQPAAKGFYRKPEDEYQWLTAWRAPQEGMGGIPKPDLRAGTSIVVYHLQ